MRTRTITVREGEWFEPVDRLYDFRSHGWDCGGSVNPSVVKEGTRTILELDRKFCSARWVYVPCLTEREIVHVGMWDGWPFWKPTPAIGYIGPMGSVEIAFFYNLKSSNVIRSEKIYTM